MLSAGELVRFAGPETIGVSGGCPGLGTVGRKSVKVVSTHPEQVACPLGVPVHKKDPC